MNFNDTVFVKLKPWARQRIEQQRVAAGVPARYASVAERPDGTSQWQLWVLMQEVGPLIAMGGNDPFAMEFEVAPSRAAVPEWVNILRASIEAAKVRADEPKCPNYDAYLVALIAARRGLEMPAGWHLASVEQLLADALAIHDVNKGLPPDKASNVEERIRVLLGNG